MCACVCVCVCVCVCWVFVVLRVQVRSFEQQGILGVDLERGLAEKMTTKFMGFLCTLTDVGAAGGDPGGGRAPLAESERPSHSSVPNRASGKEVSGGMYEGKIATLNSHIVIFCNEDLSHTSRALPETAFDAVGLLPACSS